MSARAVGFNSSAHGANASESALHSNMNGILAVDASLEGRHFCNEVVLGAKPAILAM